MPEDSEPFENTEPSAAHSELLVSPRSRPHRAIAIVIILVALIGSGIGTAFALSGGSAGSSSPAVAVDALLTAVNNEDLLGAIDAIAPGERSTIEPGAVTLIHQLQRLNLLSSSASANKVGGISLHFTGIATATSYLSPRIAAVSITHGTVTGGATLSKLPLGSFVIGLAGDALHRSVPTVTRPVSTGRSAIVTVEIGGSWYVSLGYTIAVDALRSSGKSAALPAADTAVTPLGATSPDDAVTSMLGSLASFDLRSLLADMAPGEMAALQSYAPMFLGHATTALAKARSVITVRFPNLNLSSKPVGAMTLVTVKSMGVAVTVRGISIAINGHCETVSYEGRMKRQCASGTGSSSQLLSLIPPSLRSVIQRLIHARPDYGFMTVEQEGKWYVSPVATILQSVDALASTLEPGDLEAIASYAKDPAQARHDLANIEKSLARKVSSSVPS